MHAMYSLIQCTPRLHAVMLDGHSITKYINEVGYTNKSFILYKEVRVQ